jgi:hypothetical protein
MRVRAGPQQRGALQYLQDASARGNVTDVLLRREPR